MISLSDIHSLLMNVEHPGRYVGGEFGALSATRVAEASGKDLRVALCFPDLYEIGMSNYALRLLYKMANDTPGVVCERVFAPAPDFKNALKEAGTPLYTLESRTPLHEMDVIAVTIGYELAATTLIGLLESGGVEPRAETRRTDPSGGAPILIAGGPGTANPAPWSAVFDGLFVGEAEGVFPRLLAELASAKRRSAGREEQLALLNMNPHVWTEESPQKARRAIWREFGEVPVLAGTPIPSQRVVHDHGVVEIMRGCPQGCRFCSAGVYYRPYRMKDPKVIDAEVSYLVDDLGYREITLSSLSSGDYRDIVGLFRYLNEKYGSRGVSFSLPSLRVNSLTLPVLAEISRVRRSGLTFAVETPTEAGQLSINKLVPLERTREVLEEAVARGWKLAKFYFMIGLPGDGQHTPEEIVSHLSSLREGLKVNINVTVTTFVPKPHTPFQWSRQLMPPEAEEQLRRTKQLLRECSIKMNYPDPFTSALEGVISRGDRRVGELIIEAHRRGCYLDPWDEYFKKDVWKDVVDNAGWDVLGTTLAERSTEAPLPWDSVSLGVAPAILQREYQRSREGLLTEHCAPECREPCGICNRNTRPTVLREKSPAAALPQTLEDRAASTDSDPGVRKRSPEPPQGALLLSYSKTGPAAYLPHLSTMALFERAFQRAGLPVAFTEGFNPKPRLQFAQPLSVGISSDDEVALVLLSRPDMDPETGRQALNRALPEGFFVSRAVAYPAPARRVSLMRLYYGGVFTIAGPERLIEEIKQDFGERFGRDSRFSLLERDTNSKEPAIIEVSYPQVAADGRGLKKSLQAVVGEEYSSLRIHRISTLAGDGRGRPVDYFEALAASHSFSSSSGPNPASPEPSTDPSIALKRL